MTKSSSEVEVDQILVASQPYLGQWQRLISTTNWEKGAIIARWRDAIAKSGAPASEYSDEAWARLAGGVSPQHVGRLRRVHRRFADLRESFTGLFWSHFFAALDWSDAEMWLEGAVQNEWSVSQMRRVRWETLGAAEELMPREEDVVDASFDEDASPDENASPDIDVDFANAPGETLAEVRGVAGDESEAGESVPTEGAASVAGRAERNPTGDATIRDEASAIDPFAPFKKLPSLPEDLAEAVEGFKLAIVRHRIAKWTNVAPREVAAYLDALRALALSPIES